MRSYIIRRILLVIPVLFGVTLVIFSISMSFGPDQRALLYAKSPKARRNLPAIIEKYGLNDPAYVQYFSWLSQILHGDLGWCERYGMLVTESILMFLPGTIELVLFSAPFIFIVGTRLGVRSAVNRNSLTDYLIRFFSIIGWSLPTFWSAILLLAIFYGFLGWFPPGRLGLNAQYVVESSNFHRYTHLNTIDALLNGNLFVFVDALRHLVLPVVNLVIVSSALIVLVMRSSMLEALGKSYVITARAKGLSEKEVIHKHTKKNAIIPVITISGLMFAGMITGLVATEVVFYYQGLGYWAADVTLHLDVPSILGFGLFVAVIFVIANLIVDVLYAYIDPRVRYD
ncbi:MAG: ABC transporter permease [Promethearchaeota archaeon]